MNDHDYASVAYEQKKQNKNNSNDHAFETESNKMEYEDAHCLTLPLREIDQTVNERLLRVKIIRSSRRRDDGGFSTLAKVFIEFNLCELPYGFLRKS